MSSGKLAGNTVALLTRQLMILGINVYTIRVLLVALGVDDFALFNVVLSLVMMASFLPGALGMIVQRYFSFAIGKGSPSELKRLHDGSLLMYAGATLLVIFSLETAGLWFLTNHLVVPANRLWAAQILFHLTVLSLATGMFSGFYSSIIMAHEDMHIFALFSVADAVFRLGVVLGISILSANRLELYACSLFALSVGVLTAQRIFCRRRYEECRPGPISLDFTPLREMLGFSAWTLFGQFTSIARNQAVTILVNQAFSSTTVVARALSVSIATQVLTFSNNFSSALHPPIIKAYAASEHAQMFSMIFVGSKITFFLVWVATLPILATMPGILSLWLGDYPQETVLFTRLALIENAIMAISIPLMTAVRAAGKMKRYELTLGTLQLLVLLLSWLAVRSGLPAYSVYLVAIATNIAMFAARLAIVSNITGLPARRYLNLVVRPVLLAVAASSCVTLIIMHFAPGASTFAMSQDLLGALLIYLLPVFIVYALGLSSTERRSLNAFLVRRLKRPASTS